MGGKPNKEEDRPPFCMRPIISSLMRNPSFLLLTPIPSLVCLSASKLTILSGRRDVFLFHWGLPAFFFWSRPRVVLPVPHELVYIFFFTPASDAFRVARAAVIPPADDGPVTPSWKEIRRRKRLKALWNLNQSISRLGLLCIHRPREKARDRSARPISSFPNHFHNDSSFLTCFDGFSFQSQSWLFFVLFSLRWSGKFSFL